jgi:UDPglucose--hexose-1-phosphate uridylyltransferase
MPPPEYNPLAPTKDPNFPTELAQGQYDVAVFDNRFPSMTLFAHDAPECIVETLPANGACEIVVFTQDSQASLGSLDLDHLDLLLQVWADRTHVLGEHPQIQYVLPFENRGVEVGYLAPSARSDLRLSFCTTRPRSDVGREQAYYQLHQQSLLQDLIQREIEDNQRIIYQDEHAIAFVPVCARYPYEFGLHRSVSCHIHGAYPKAGEDSPEH